MAAWMWSDFFWRLRSYLAWFNSNSLHVVVSLEKHFTAYFFTRQSLQASLNYSEITLKFNLSTNILKIQK